MLNSAHLTAEGMDRRTVEQLIRTKYPAAVVNRIDLIDSAIHGQQVVSTAQRMAIAVEYGDNTPADWPVRLSIKFARPGFGDLPLYDNEVNVYTRLGDELPVNTPTCMGGVRDVAGSAFALVLEDLRAADAEFPSVLSPTTPDDMTILLDQFARLHAEYWESPRLRDKEFDWLHEHTKGPLHDLFTDQAGVPMVVAWQVDTMQFKRELLESVDETAATLLTKVSLAQAHQATLPRTLLHGDAHIGNTYVLPNGARGLLDWQLTSRGFCMHDVSYILTTGLSVRDRREHEKDLIDYYRDRLIEYGVPDPPSTLDLFDEHRLAMAWCFYIGWLTTPIENYGWEINVANHVRLATAYRDLGSKHALDALR